MIQQTKKIDNYAATSSVNVQVAYPDDAVKSTKEINLGFKISKSTIWVLGIVVVMMLFLLVFSGSPSEDTGQETREQESTTQDIQKQEVYEEWLEMPESEEEAIDDIISFMNVINQQKNNKANGKENYEMLYINTFAEYLKRLQVEYPNLDISDQKWHALIEEKIDAYQIAHKDFEDLALELLKDKRFKYIADFENWFSE